LLLSVAANLLLPETIPDKGLIIINNSNLNYNYSTKPVMTSEAKLQSDVMAPLNNGWAELREKGISKLEDFLTNGKAIDFTRKEYMQLYTTVYNLSTM
jgi:hypothetical protein